MSSGTTVSRSPTKPRRTAPQSATYDRDDDWTGLASSALRRRVQNRLNQRAYRARREERVQKEKQINNSTGEHDHADDLCSTVVGNEKNIPTAVICKLTEAQHLRCTFAPSNLHALMSEFEKRAFDSYVNGSPQTELLINLSRLNVLRAAYDNAVAIGMTAEWLCEDDSISIFSIHGPKLAKNIPLSLAPTALQQSTPHHPWLDIFPFPRMRDNLIRAGDNLEDDELCHDLTAFWDTRTSHARLLVWGLPSCPENWEVTEEFAKKWGFFLQGCPDILKSTNNWRTRRGEKPLVWKRIFGIN